MWQTSRQADITFAGTVSRLNRDLNGLEQCSGSRGSYREIFAATKHIGPLQMALRRLARRPTTPTMSQHG
jgi:hypothetical protein